MRSNESALDEMGQVIQRQVTQLCKFGQVTCIQRIVPSNGTALREIAWHTFRQCHITSNGTSLREIAQHTSRQYRVIIS